MEWADELELSRLLHGYRRESFNRLIRCLTSFRRRQHSFSKTRRSHCSHDVATNPAAFYCSDTSPVHHSLSDE